MRAPAWENPNDFLQVDDFAFPAVITLQGGGTIPVSVIYDEHGVQAEAGEFTHDTSTPQATCRLDLVGAVKRGDSITITFPEGPQTFGILAAPRPKRGGGFGILDLAP